MTDNQGEDQDRREPGLDVAQERPIVISGLDEEAGVPVERPNVSPTDDAALRMQQQKPRGEPEDEDG